MRSFDATQTAIAASNHKRLKVLFDVTKAGSSAVDYYWSTQPCTYDGQEYAFKIDPESFTGVTLQKDSSEMGIAPPNTCGFSVVNTAIDTSASAVTKDALAHWRFEPDALLADSAGSATLVNTGGVVVDETDKKEGAGSAYLDQTVAQYLSKGSPYTWVPSSWPLMYGNTKGTYACWFYVESYEIGRASCRERV